MCPTLVYFPGTKALKAIHTLTAYDPRRTGSRSLKAAGFGPLTVYHPKQNYKRCEALSIVRLMALESVFK